MIKKFLLHPIHYTRLLSIRKSIYDVVGELSAEAYPSAEPIPFKEIKNATFKKVETGYNWGHMFGCCWFAFKGVVPQCAKGKQVVLLLDVEGEGVVYDMTHGGEIKQGITQVLSKIDNLQSTKGKQVVDLFENAEGGENVDVLVDCGFNGINEKKDKAVVLARKDIAIKNLDVFGYYYDYLTLIVLMLTKCKNELLEAERVSEINSALNASYKKFIKGDTLGARAILLAVINKQNDKPCTKYSAIGHAHLDLAWLWPIRETKRKAVRTFSTAVHNLEVYPGYMFGASQAQQFDWVKKNQPEFYEKLKQKVLNGRIEIQGGMWTENDSNVPCGESLIRQFTYGDKFFFDEFGIRSKMVWLPDAFGFPASLPQIYKGCEKEYFMTIKLSWNKYNQFPYKTFVWKGIDGSEVLSHMPPKGDYNSTGSPIALTISEKKNKQKKDIDKALLLFGVGDGGGGPGEAQIAFAERQKDMKGINPVTVRKAEEFFGLLKEDLYKIPTYNGELYLEKHQGTYTSQGRNKKYNYLLERELHYVEWLCAVALTKGIKYPKDKLDEIWKEVLLYQFHDIIPGSSIERVYTESCARYEAMLNELYAIEKDLFLSFGGSKKEAIFNSCPFEINGYSRLNEKWYSVDAKPYSEAKLKKADNNTAVLSYEENAIENNRIKLVFDKNGVICSMFDKVNSKEISKGGLNRLVINTDPKMYYDAWDIKKDYQKSKTTVPALVGKKSFIDGKAVNMELTYATKASKICQKITLVEGDNLVRIETQVDWHEKHKMLRAEFYPTIYSDTVNCDIQFGSVNRSTKNETDIEKAQYEICAHKYAAVQNGEATFAIINNCKYGHRIKEGLMSLNLLRSPKYPDPNCDMGKHSFSYAIYAGKGNIEDNDLVAKSYEFSYPLVASTFGAQIPDLIRLEGKGIILETIKPSEDGKGIVARLYEKYGKAAKCKLNAGFEYKAVYQTNMLERAAEKTTTNLTFKPFEIKTIYFEI